MDERDKELQDLRRKVNNLIDNLTYEDLNKAAKRLGYGLIPRYSHVKKHQCICGRKRFEYWHDKDGTFVKCPECGRRGASKDTERKADLAWNEFIQNELLSMPEEDSRMS